MALRPGEDLAATLFADVHYFYGAPTAKPPHHRFDKGSYVYLFESPSQRRARIEVANNAGTSDQDAFDGYLDGAHIQYSYKHTTLVTLTVESPDGHRITPLDIPEWHLPTFDPRNENKYMYKLQSLDIYFWAKEDAMLFVNAVRRVLPPQQVTVLDEPVAPPPHHDPMSSVVQKLENVAITDPSYQHGQTRDSRTSLPGPPAGPPSGTPKTQPAFVPLAYNPADPAPPEAIQHREKTPPPEDGAGNPLVAAAAVDQGQYNHPSQSGGQPQGSYFPSNGIPPVKPPSGPQSPYAHHFQNSFAPPPTAPTNSSPYTYPPAASSSPSVPAFQQHTPQAFGQHSSQGVPSVPSAIALPGLPQNAISPQQTPGSYTPGPPSQGPPGGFAQYNYGTQPVSGVKPLQQDYGIHSQIYRPTEGENSTKHNEKPVPVTGAKPPSGKLEQRASQLEKGVGSFLRKLEKKF